MKYPTNHRELFLMAIENRVSVIHEFCVTDIRFEGRRLQRWARNYRDQHENELIDLDLPDALFGIYYEDEEADSEIDQTLNRWELDGDL